MEIIKSLQNPQLKRIIKLRKASSRKKEQTIIIEGRAELSLALAAGLEFDSFFLCPSLFVDKEPLPTRNNSYQLSEELFTKISLRESPDGYLALAKPVYKTLVDIKLSKNPLLIILESLEKPGNIGAILRTADAVRADAVILADSRTDMFNPNVIRASLGTVFVNTVVAAAYDEISAWLKKHNIQTLAMTPSAEKNYTELDLSVPLAVLIGTEHEGLSEKWLQRAELKAKIPMLGQIDSLNASVSTAVVVYEALRQRTSN